MRKLLLFWALAAAVFVAGCSDDDAAETTPAQPGTDTLAYMQQLQDSAYAAEVVNNIYNITVDAPTGDTVYTVKHGVCLSDASPNNYYVACKSAAEALDFYKIFCSNQVEEIAVGGETADKLTDRESKFGKNGSTAIRFGDGNPAYATIEISMSSVGQTHQIYFVPQAYIDANNSEHQYFSSPYSIGDIVRDENNEQWLCVKMSGISDNGILVRMCSDGYKVASITDEVKTVYYRESSTRTLASKMAWEALLKGINYMNLSLAADVIIGKTYGVDMGEFATALKCLKGMSDTSGWLSVQQMGSPSGIRKCGHWWLWMSVWNCGWFPLYQIQLPFVRFESGKSVYVGSSFSCKEFNTCGGRIGDSTLKSGLQLVQREFYDEEITGSKVLWPLKDYQTTAGK